MSDVISLRRMAAQNWYRRAPTTEPKTRVELDESPIPVDVSLDPAAGQFRLDAFADEDGGDEKKAPEHSLLCSLVLSYSLLIHDFWPRGTPDSG